MRRSLIAGTVVLLAMGVGCTDSATTDSGGSNNGPDDGFGGVSNNGGANNGGANNGGANNGGANNGGANNGGANNGGANNGGANNGGANNGGANNGGANNGANNGDPEECFSVAFEAVPAVRPVDIIWIIDASPSMGEEIAQVEANLGVFSERIGGAGLDHHVILIGSDRDLATPGKDYFEICVPPPLSAEPVCPDVDSDTYLHVREPVHSQDGLDIAMDSYPDWKHFLRTNQGSDVHVIMVTDDNVGWGTDAAEFEQFLSTAVAPGFPRGVTFHSIVDLIGYQPSCAFDDSCSCGEERGQEYIDLSDASGGLVLDLCQEDWSPIFEELEREVVEGTEIPCGFTLPAPEDNRRIDYDRVNVVFVGDGDNREIIPQVDTEADCALTGGWYYDNPQAPTVIHLCEQACDRLTQRVEVEIGCETVKY